MKISSTNLNSETLRGGELKLWEEVHILQHCHLSQLHKVGISGIQDNERYHFSQKLSPYKMSKKKGVLDRTNFCHRIKWMKQKNKKKLRQKKLVYRKQVCVSKTSFCPKKYVREKIPSENKFPSQKRVLVTETSSFWVTLRDTNFCHRNLFLRQKKVFVTENKKLSERKSSVRETSFVKKKILAQKQVSVTKKLRSQKQVSVTKKSFCNRNKFL